MAFGLPRTQEALASAVATSSESVARALARLRKQGVIETPGSAVRILDFAALQARIFGRRPAIGRTRRRAVQSPEFLVVMRTTPLPPRTPY
jgi:DNA-binding Lrp family transcriptional regulator